MIHTSGLEHGLEILLAGWVFLILISVFNFLSFSMISYHCSVILSLFIIFYLFCNYLSRLYLSLFVYDCLLGELCAHLFEFLLLFVIWGRTITWQNYFLYSPIIYNVIINSPPFVMAPFAEHWNVTALDFSLNKALFYLTDF